MYFAQYFGGWGGFCLLFLSAPLAFCTLFFFTTKKERVVLLICLIILSNKSVLRSDDSWDARESSCVLS